MTDADRTDAPPPADPLSPAEPGAAPAATADLGRRRFFRQFAGELANTAATMVGTVQALQKTSAELAGSILDPGRVAGEPLADGGAPAVHAAPDSSATGVAAGAAFRTSFRLDGGAIRFVDQRALPRSVVEHSSRSAAEVAWAIRNQVVLGGPAIGQAAAVGLALTADRVRTTRPYARRATLRGAANALINAAPTHASARWAVDRVMAAYAEVGELSEDGAAIADAMNAEAERIIGEVAAEHGRIVEAGLATVDALPRPESGPLRLLVHGPSGTLAGGQFGTALSIAIAAHHAEREIRVIVPEARPGFSGARISCWELAAAGVAHTLVVDAAATALVAAGEVDAILIPADRVAANGDVAATIGSHALAAVAARRQVPFYVCAPASSIDLAAATGASIIIAASTPSELERVGDVALAPPGTEISAPAHDITPAELVTGYLTGTGFRTAPFVEPGG
jgi:methylthioribose-1-phosphate isomerase